MTWTALRQPISNVLYSCHHKARWKLDEILISIDIEPVTSAESKAKLLDESLAAVPDERLVVVAQKLLSKGIASCEHRTEIEDVLWSRISFPDVHARMRREIATALDDEHGADKLYFNADGFDQLLHSLFCVSRYVDYESHWQVNPQLSEQVQQHCHRNHDWNFSLLFEKLGAWSCGVKRFMLLLEGLASALVRPDVPMQNAFVATINRVIKVYGLEMRHVSDIDGYPVYSFVSLHVARGKPKNIIFASFEKPDIVLVDALSNDIEIRTNADRVLVYDRQISEDGLRWGALQQWYSELKGLPDNQATGQALYKRLREALPANSPPQLHFLKGYYSAYKDLRPQLPALLPEVWHHWDPKSAVQRQKLAFPNFRMDFLALLPGGTRIVIEVDGMQHYSVDGIANPQLYAKNVSSDRAMKLAGYDVYRFGGTELRTEEEATKRVKELFDQLFARHAVVFRK